MCDKSFQHSWHEEKYILKCQQNYIIYSVGVFAAYGENCRAQFHVWCSWRSSHCSATGGFVVWAFSGTINLMLRGKCLRFCGRFHIDLCVLSALISPNPLPSMEWKNNRKALINFPPFLIRENLFSQQTRGKKDSSQNLCNLCQQPPSVFYRGAEMFSQNIALMMCFTAGSPRKSGNQWGRLGIERDICEHLLRLHSCGPIKMRFNIPRFPINFGDTSAAFCFMCSSRISWSLAERFATSNKSLHLKPVNASLRKFNIFQYWCIIGK